MKKIALYKTVGFIIVILLPASVFATKCSEEVPKAADLPAIQEKLVMRIMMCVNQTEHVLSI